MEKEYDHLTNDNSDQEQQDEEKQNHQQFNQSSPPFDEITTALETSQQSSYFGSNFVFAIQPNGQPKYTLGPHYPLFMCTWISFIVADIFLISLVWNNADSIFWTLLTFLVSAIHVLSYLGTAIKNPGIAHSKDFESTELKRIDSLSRKQESKILCKVCNVLKDTRTMHCDACNVCVRGYDHHCPWTGKCIAKGNIQWFNVFLAMTFIFMAYAVIVTVVTLMPPPRSRIPRTPVPSSP